jgi:AraC-like DNA-binding protein
MVESRGHLNPGDAAVRFDRFALGLDALVRHVWVVRWDVPAGEVRPQRVLAYPACNAVLTPQDARLYGPNPALGVQRLEGRSWAVGILLRPAAARLLTTTPPRDLVGRHEPLPHAPHAEVVAAMASDDAERLSAVLRTWLAPFAARVGAAGLAANEVCRIAEERDDVVRVADLADEVGTTTRSLSRLVRDRVGVSPKWLIECRRLQRAAMSLYARPDTHLAALAGDLGYADQAHFTRRYRQVLGETPDQTRRAGREAARRG